MMRMVFTYEPFNSGVTRLGDRRYDLAFICPVCFRREKKEIEVTRSFLDSCDGSGEFLRAEINKLAPWCMCVDDSKRVRFRIGSAYQRKHRLTKRQVNP